MPKAMSVRVKMTFDGKEVVCQPNQKVLDAALENGIHIPTICYNPLYDGDRLGSCRLCLVEVVGGGRPGLQPACTLPVSSDLKVSTCSEAVFQARRTAVELLLSEHVQKCRDCIASGSCKFAELCREYDVNGVPVCAECPNQGEACHLSRGTLCMGPITFADCNAFCTRSGYPCEGCHSVASSRDVLRFGVLAYIEKGFTREEVLEGARIYSWDAIGQLESVMEELAMARKTSMEGMQ